MMTMSHLLADSCLLTFNGWGHTVFSAAQPVPAG
jgi:hypothetical protein